MDEDDIFYDYPRTPTGCSTLAVAFLLAVVIITVAWTFYEALRGVSAS